MGSYYPAVGFRFDVQIASPLGAAGMMAGLLGLSPDGSFQEVSGFNTEMEFDSIREGGENRFEHKLPKGTKFTNLVLKRGLVTVKSTLGNWCMDTFQSDLSNEIEINDLVISLLDHQRWPLMTWTVYSAYPVKWEVSNLNSMQNEIAVETVEFAYRRFERTSFDITL